MFLYPSIHSLICWFSFSICGQVVEVASSNISLLNLGHLMMFPLKRWQIILAVGSGYFLVSPHIELCLEHQSISAVYISLFFWLWSTHYDHKNRAVDWKHCLSLPHYRLEQWPYYCRQDPNLLIHLLLHLAIMPEQIQTQDLNARIKVSPLTQRSVSPFVAEDWGLWVTLILSGSLSAVNYISAC